MPKYVPGYCLILVNMLYYVYSERNLKERMYMSKKTTSIIFTGDIGFDRYMDKKWEDENLLSQGVLDFFNSADHTVANVEGALIDAVDDGSRGVFFHSKTVSNGKPDPSQNPQCVFCKTLDRITDCPQAAVF